MQKRVTVKFLEETEGAFRYREVNSAGRHIHGDSEGATIGDVYLRKMAMGDRRPEQIVITLEY